MNFDMFILRWGVSHLECCLRRKPELKYETCKSVTHWDNKMFFIEYLGFCRYPILTIFILNVFLTIWPESGFVNIVQGLNVSVVQCLLVQHQNWYFLHIVKMPTPPFHDVENQITLDNNGISSKDYSRFRVISYLILVIFFPQTHFRPGKFSPQKCVNFRQNLPHCA